MHGELCEVEDFCVIGLFLLLNYHAKEKRPYDVRVFGATVDGMQNWRSGRSVDERVSKRNQGNELAERDVGEGGGEV